MLCIRNIIILVVLFTVKTLRLLFEMADTLKHTNGIVRLLSKASNTGFSRPYHGGNSWRQVVNVFSTGF